MRTPAGHLFHPAAQRIWAVLVAVGVCLAILQLPSGSARAAVPVPAARVGLPAQVDLVDQYQGQQLCDPTPKVGTLALRDTLWRTYGSGYWAGISRNCNVSWDRGISEHKDGRAIDWGVSVRNEAAKAIGDAFLAWVTANNGEMARRMGIMYVIWDSRMWRTYGMDRGWTEYGSCATKFTAASYDTTCHRDHMHISLTWHGAAAETSWYSGKAVLGSSCRAGSPAQRASGSPGSPSVLFDPMAGVGTSGNCYLGNSVQSVKVPVPDNGRAIVQRIRVSGVRANAPSPVRIFSAAGSVTVPAGSAPRELVLPVGADGLIYFQQPVGQSTLHVEGLGKTLAVAAGGTIEIPVAGGSARAASGAIAVSVNVAVTQPATAGFVRVYPCGSSMPATSNLNFAAGQTIANSVLVGIGESGKICVFSTALTQLVVDFGGYVPAGAGFTPVVPRRLLDTRLLPGKPGAGSDVVVRVPNGAAAAALNVAVTQPDGDGWLAVYPCGTAFKGTSNVNYSRGQTIANGVLTTVGANGTVCVKTMAPAHIVVDLMATVAPGAGFTASGPHRLADTRTRGAALQPGTDLVIPVPPGAPSVALSVASTASAAPGWLLAYPCGGAMPVASTVNYAAGQTIANSAIVKVGASGTVCVRTSAPSHVVVDLSGQLSSGLFIPSVPVRLLDTRES